MASGALAQACPYSRQPSGGEGGGGGGGDMQGEFLLKFGRYVLQLAVGPHDVANRLNYQHSVLLLLLVAGIVALKLFVFKPIQASALCSRSHSHSHSSSATLY